MSGLARRLKAEGYSEEPYWWLEARPSAPPPQPLPARADVLVIGAGYAGLNCALPLARRGVSVLVVDAEMPGFGGSSRNGGQLGSGWFMIDLAAEDQGAMKARVESANESLAHAIGLMEQEGLAADCYQPVGKVSAAFAPAHLEKMRRKAEWAAANSDLPVTLLDRAGLAEELGSDFYFGGVCIALGGLVQPARYLAGLLARAEAAGVEIRAPVRVTELERVVGGYRVTTTAGSLDCTEVVVATNGYTGPATPELQRKVVPLASYIIATEPLPEGLPERLIPKRRGVSDTARVLAYYRLSPDGRRMLFGGRSSFRSLAAGEGARGLQRMMVRRFPALAEARITHAWMGNVAFARDRLPHMGSAEGLHWALCCNGSGVAMMSYLGSKIARRLLDRPNAPLCAFDGGAFPGIPLYRGDPWFLPAVGTTYRFRDFLDRLWARAA